MLLRTFKGKEDAAVDADAENVRRRHMLASSLLLAALATVTVWFPAEATAQDTQSKRMAIAIRQRDVSAVRRLVEGGEDLNQRLFNGATPLIKAAASESWDIVLYLLKAGADASVRNKMGTTVAEMAQTSRVAPHTRAYEDLAEVKRILGERGLL